MSDGGDHSRYRRELVGFVFQDHYLLPDLTAGANVELPQIGSGVGRRERAARARELLEEVSVAHRIDVLARHLLADEPTGSLDSESARRVLDRGRARAARMTLLVVTYDPAVAERADTVLHLLDGRLVNGDRPAALRPREQLDP